MLYTARNPLLTGHCYTVAAMAFHEGSTSPNVRLDTGANPKVPGPHDPMETEPFDELVIGQLRANRDEALIRRDAHSAELELQGKFHAAQIERYDRVVRACNSALHELEISQQEEQAYGTGTVTQQPVSRNTIS